MTKFTGLEALGLTYEKDGKDPAKMHERAAGALAEAPNPPSQGDQPNAARGAAAAPVRAGTPDSAIMIDLSPPKQLSDAEPKTSSIKAFFPGRAVADDNSQKERKQRKRKEQSVSQRPIGRVAQAEQHLRNNRLSVELIRPFPAMPITNRDGAPVHDALIIDSDDKKAAVAGPPTRVAGGAVVMADTDHRKMPAMSPTSTRAMKLRKLFLQEALGGTPTAKEKKRKLYRALNDPKADDHGPMMNTIHAGLQGAAPLHIWG